ncbi:MAG: C39 family peptidase [Hespellia sp.]|nr:C39 family peptidase [Hespellia sp.]
MNMNRAYRRPGRARVRRKRLKRLCLCLFVILILVLILCVGKRVILALAGAVTDRGGAEFSQERNLNAVSPDVKVASPVRYSREDAAAQLETMSNQDRRYAQIIENAAVYPDSLLKDLANNPEMLEFVLGYPKDPVSLDSILLTDTERDSSCPLLLQWDQRWGYQPYGEDNIAISGCGPTALSMVITGLTHSREITPAQVAEYSSANDYYQEGAGTKWALMTEGAAHYGLTAEEVVNDENAMKDALDRGALIICSVSEGDFTTSGHFIVICGYGKSGFWINDPFCIYRSEQSWTFQQLTTQIAGMWAMSV